MPLLTQAAGGVPDTASIIISVAFMLLLGFLMTRLTKLLHLPNVTAYIVTGILIGPGCLGLVSAEVIAGMDFLADIALAFIAFSTGRFFRLAALRANGGKVVIITLFEALLSMLAVFILTFFILKLELAFSLVLSSLASATASASTVVTIRQSRARGDFVDTLLQVIAVDNIFALLAYSVAISVAVTLISGAALDTGSILTPLLTNLGALALGGIFGLLLKAMIRAKRSTDNRLIIIIAALFGFCGICALLDISPLLGCMSMGTVYINLIEDEQLFKQVNYFTPPILLLYFVRSGASFNMSALLSPSGAVGATPLIVIGLLYFAVRLVGKYGGAFLGSLVTKKPPSVRNYLGMALVPQAGVAIGLAALGARTLGGETGAALETIILASSILYELVGPASAKFSLYLSHSISDNLEELAPIEEAGKSQLDILIERIHTIQKELPAHEVDEEEAAFNSAVEDQYTPPPDSRRDLRRRRRF